MKLCILIDSILPSVGGMGKSTERFAKLLKLRNYKITIITGHNKNIDICEYINGLKVYKLKGFTVPFTNGIYTLSYPRYAIIKEILEKEKIDIILLVSYLFFALIINKIADELKIPIVYGHHVQPENLSMPMHINFYLINWIISRWFKFIAQRSKIIITPSVFSRKLLKSYGVKKQIVTITNGIDTKSFNPENVSEEIFRNRFKLKNKRFLLSVGRLMSEKNIEFLITTFSHIDFSESINKDLVLVIVGNGPDKEKLKDKAKELQLSRRIIFTGIINDGVLLKSAYNGAEIFIHPSLIETEGMVILEAMALGKPILVSNSKKSASADLIKKGVNGLTFNPYNDRALAKKIITLVNNKKILRKMGEESLKIIKNYDINKSVDKMDIIFRKIIRINQRGKLC